MGNSQALQVKITLTWSELGRAKNVTLQEVRF
jgi:hypothetical protein